MTEDEALDALRTHVRRQQRLGGLILGVTAAAVGVILQVVNPVGESAIEFVVWSVFFALLWGGFMWLLTGAGPFSAPRKVIKGLHRMTGATVVEVRGKTRVSVRLAGGSNLHLPVMGGSDGIGPGDQVWLSEPAESGKSVLAVGCDEKGRTRVLWPARPASTQKPWA